MEGQACLAIFSEILETEKNRADYIDERAPDCGCEMCRVSEHGDGHVEHQEKLVRLIADDTHLKPDAVSGELRLKSTFMDDSITFGSSTLRLGKATREEFKRQIQLLTDGKIKQRDGTPKEVIGYVIIPASLVRELEFTAALEKVSGKVLSRDETKKIDHNEITKRSNAIYATGIAEVPSHADIFGSNLKYLLRAGRNRLITSLGDAIKENFVVITSHDEILDLGVESS